MLPCLIIYFSQLAYLAPEYLKGYEKTCAHDMWAIGVILYLFYSRPSNTPFHGLEGEQGYNDGRTITPYHCSQLRSGNFDETCIATAAPWAKRAIRGLLTVERYTTAIVRTPSPSPCSYLLFFQLHFFSSPKYFPYLLFREKRWNTQQLMLICGSNDAGYGMAVVPLFPRLLVPFIW